MRWHLQSDVLLLLPLQGRCGVLAAVGVLLLLPRSAPLP